MPKPFLIKDSKRAAEQARQRAALIDEFGRLDEKIAPLRSSIRRLEELGKTLREFASSADAESSVTLSGKTYEVVAGPMKLQTHIESLHLVYKELGAQRFIAACSMTIKSLEANLPAARVAALTRKDRSGPRTLVARKVAA